MEFKEFIPGDLIYIGLFRLHEVITDLQSHTFCSRGNEECRSNSYHDSLIVSRLDFGSKEAAGYIVSHEKTRKRPQHIK